VIDDRKDINIPLTFDFQATLLNTNKGVMSQALNALGAVLASPLFIQLGLVTPEQLYNWAHDLIQSSQLDTGRYIKKPMGMPDGPRITVEEAILDMTNGIMPSSTDFVCPTQEALQQLMQFAQSDAFGFLTGGKELLFKAYLQQVMERARMEMQQQMMLQSAAQFSQMMGQQGGGEGGRPPEMGQAPEMQTQSPSMDEMMGADRAA
jgi:hypothetical protein